MLVAVQGVLPKETRFTCTACAGTLLLEFGTLSRLTRNPVYEHKARQAVMHVFGESSCLLPGKQRIPHATAVVVACTCGLVKSTACHLRTSLHTALLCG